MEVFSNLVMRNSSRMIISPWSMKNFIGTLDEGMHTCIAPEKKNERRTWMRHLRMDLDLDFRTLPVINSLSLVMIYIELESRNEMKFETGSTYSTQRLVPCIPV